MKRIRVKEKELDDGTVQHEFPASPDGTNTYGYKAGSVYDLPDKLADTFIREGWGVESDASDESTTELPEGYDLPETEEARRDRVANAAGISPPGLSAIAASSPGAVEEVIARNPHLAREGSGIAAVATARALHDGSGEIRDIDGDGTPHLVGDVDLTDGDIGLPNTNETPTAEAIGAQPVHYPPSDTPGGVSDPGGADVDGDGVGDAGQSTPDDASGNGDDGKGADVDGDGKGDDGRSVADNPGTNGVEMPPSSASRSELDAAASQLGLDPTVYPNKEAVRDALAAELGE